MSARSKRLAGPMLLSPAGTVLWTSPGAQVTLCKTLWLRNEGAAPETVTLQVDPSDGGLGSFWSQVLAANQSVLLTDLPTLNPTELLRGVASVGMVRVTLSGSVLTA